ncbi:MAG TPA: metallopeptidase TldD-related protein [Polyangiaceae bacterium]|nr:metallopeptidase TldD-related protein [Polyangiaceae bacterium]
MPSSPPYQAPFLPGGSHPIDADTCDRLLSRALSRGGHYADLFFEFGASASYSFEEGLLKSSSRAVEIGLGVRVQCGDATGYAFTQDLDWDRMAAAADTAARIARSGAPVPPQPVGSLPVPSRYPLPAFSLVAPGASKRDLLERASRAAFAADPLILKVEAGFVESLRQIMVATSDGILVRDTQPMIRFSVRALAERAGLRRYGSSGGGGRLDMSYFDRLSPEHHAALAARQAVTMLDARDAPAGQLEVILAPGDSGILLHEAVGHGLEADFNRKGTSNYSGRIGTPVASSLCTVVDDATPAHARGSINVDDEGIVPSRTVLIQDGTLVGYMQDRLSARHYKAPLTGNGRREGFASHPLPRMTNTFLLAGSSDPEQMLRSVKYGVYARSFGGGQVDISNGDFVFSLTESYLIEDGHLTAPLKDVNLIGNGPEVLQNVVELGNDFKASDGIWTCGKEGQSVAVGVGCPTVKISRITVGGTRLS